MNWKAEATEKLRRYASMCQAVQNIPQEISRLELAACSLRSPAIDKPAVKSTTSREDALLDNLVHRQELDRSLQQAQHWLDTTDRALSVLTPDEALVLQHLYIYPQKNGLDRLCEILEVETSSIYRRRDKALRKFTLALYGAESS